MPSPEEELAEIRQVLRRLQAREAALMLEVDRALPPQPPLRVGWPIRRLGAAELH
ncbi:hypothetical protein KM031_09045 [Gemmobacter fulvus]|uniref:Uncharacterized protein n=1 Tax=Gemmobacter fulvus TaxID=2840474 RepID=A0A975S095_9RHOB|nr:hypothetical protein [Gemmobacter fulvus]MBT9246878.1 hypothetical protein [Gemmobacter fulvus]MDQ1850696.1 hypothetical protein [Gemmobacter fulvus]QWK89031.1 hypothetical protein KM031_09045 [Gemmobacter fulvus]